MEIPISALSEAALRGVIEEFVSREGTDYGGEVPFEAKVAQVRRQLEAGSAVLVFDPETESCTLVTRDELKRRG